MGGEYLVFVTGGCRTRRELRHGGLGRNADVVS